MTYFKKTVFLLFVLTRVSAAVAQGNYENMGRQAFMKSDFKGAIAQLEKIENNDGNSSVLKMLGYSYYQCGDYDKATDAYSRLITLKPNDYSSYYYRGKARLNIANAPKESLNALRENFYLTAIKDFTKAIEINGEDDPQILQNRGIAYKDYAIFKSYKIKKAPEKAACVAQFNNAVSDFQKVLTVQPFRKDIISLIDYVKAQIASLK